MKLPAAPESARRRLRGWAVRLQALLRSLAFCLLSSVAWAQLVPNNFNTVTSSATGFNTGILTASDISSSSSYYYNLDFLGSATGPALYVRHGTLNGTEAYAFTVQVETLVNLSGNVNSNYPSGAGSYVGVLIDWNGSGSISGNNQVYDLGVVLSFTNAATSTYTLSTFTVTGNNTATASTGGTDGGAAVTNPITFSALSHIETGTISIPGASSNTTTYGSASNSRVALRDTAGTDYISFAIKAGDSNVSNSLPQIGVSSGSTVSGFALFSGDSSTVLASSTFNAIGDIAGSSSNRTLYWSTLSAVPDTPTYLAVCGMVAPAVILVLRRRR